MTGQDVARLEAVRASCVAAVAAARAALQTVEAMLMTDDREQAATDDNPWGTFDDDDAPTNPGASR